MWNCLGSLPVLPSPNPVHGLTFVSWYRPTYTLRGIPTDFRPVPWRNQLSQIGFFPRTPSWTFDVNFGFRPLHLLREETTSPLFPLVCSVSVGSVEDWGVPSIPTVSVTSLILPVYRIMFRWINDYPTIPGVFEEFHTLPVSAPGISGSWCDRSKYISQVYITSRILLISAKKKELKRILYLLFIFQFYSFTNIDKNIRYLWNI